MLQAFRFTLLVNKLNGLRKLPPAEVLALQRARPFQPGRWGTVVAG